MAAAMMPLSQGDTDDNKYAKKKAGLLEVSSRGCDALGALDFKAFFTSKGLAQLLQNPFQLYTTFLIGGLVVYNRLGGSLTDATTVDKLSYLSTICEGFGLISLRHKIKSQHSVAGISGTTIAMYALVYTLREVLLLPPMTWRELDGWAIEVVQVVSLLMVFDVLRSVRETYQKTYQEDLDAMKMKHLLPACLVLALLLRPSFQEGGFFSFLWTAYFYTDVLALLPQVVMMARSSGKITAPIAHFVAATSFSRVVDLCFWFYEFDSLGPQLNFYLPGTINYSAWLIVIFHLFSLLLVADFMYYYLKARLSGSSFSEDLEVPALDYDVC